ncbi:hypothetical protein ACG7TL_003261 [Trametes sanguinea]
MRVLITAPEVIQVLPELPVRADLMKNLYDSHYDKFFLALAATEQTHLAVERLRRAPAARPIPRAWRVCRFCQVRAAVEDEPHVLLYCPAPLLCARRDCLVAELTTVQPSMPPLLARLAPEAALDVLLSADPTTVLPLVADYVADVFELCSTPPPPCDLGAARLFSLHRAWSLHFRSIMRHYTGLRPLRRDEGSARAPEL